jgi:hypothetical protein
MTQQYRFVIELLEYKIKARFRSERAHLRIAGMVRPDSVFVQEHKAPGEFSLLQGPAKIGHSFFNHGQGIATARVHAV